MTSPRVLVIENSPSDPLGRLGDWLTAAGLELAVVTGTELPVTLDGYAGLVVLGGPMGANDDQRAPWLPHERALLRDAVSTELPTLGVCLGAQLLAAAHGAPVGRNPAGPELGAQLVAKRTAASTDPLWRELPITPDVLQWHFDAIATLPAGAIHLASSPVCDNQAFRLGRLAWGIQFHIEAPPAIAQAWAAANAPQLADYDLDAILDRISALDPDIAEVWAPFVARFAEVVREPAAVPAARGVPTSTAAPVTDAAAIRAALAAEAGAARGVLPLPTRRPGDR